MNVIVSNIIRHQVEKESKKFIVPHFPGGVLTPEALRKMADACEAFPEARLKISGELMIGGITDSRRNDACREKLGLPTFSIAGPSVRPVKACAGGYICDNNVQDTFALSLKLDKLFAGRPLPFKMIIAVSGCGRNCSEPRVRDIGVVAQKNGYVVFAGGAAGGKPRIAREIATVPDDEQVVVLVEKIIQFYAANGRTMERLGAVIERLGMDTFCKACGLSPVPDRTA